MSSQGLVQYSSLALEHVYPIYNGFTTKLKELLSIHLSIIPFTHFHSIYQYLRASKLSNGAEVVMLNASQNPDTPLLADYSSMLTVHLTLLSQLGIYSIRCGTLNNYNETFINLNTTNGMLKCFYALQTQCTYIWLRDPLPISICAAI